MRRAVVLGLCATAFALASSAAEFHLKYKTIPQDQIMAFPGGYGMYGQLQLRKPAEVNKEPKAKSSRPLYGVFREASTLLLFRLDESKGTGKGYDELLLDVNGNRDLTDETVVSRVPTPGMANRPASNEARFGPIEGPASKELGGIRPVYFAQAYVYSPPQGAEVNDDVNYFAGQLTIRAGWYLETMLVIDGKSYKAAVYDGNASFKLGDVPKCQTYRSGNEEQYYFTAWDSLLVDMDGSGRFDNNVRNSEALPFGSIVYFGAKPCKLALAADLKTLSVSPWTDPLAEVALEPRGEQVSTVTMARQGEGNDWQMIRAVVADGKVQLPPGKYRLYATTLLAKDGSGKQVFASAYQRNATTAISFDTGKGGKLKVGGPLELAVKAEKRTPYPYEQQKATEASASEYVLAINTTVQGAGQETYSSYASGRDFETNPNPPKFVIKSAAGKQIASGNLEYG